MRNKHLLLVFVAMLGLAFEGLRLFDLYRWKELPKKTRRKKRKKKLSGSCPNHREMQPLMDICCLVTPCITRFQHIGIAFLTTNIGRLLSP